MLSTPNSVLAPPLTFGTLCSAAGAQSRPKGGFSPSVDSPSWKRKPLTKSDPPKQPH